MSMNNAKLDLLLSGVLAAWGIVSLFAQKNGQG